MVTHVLAIEYQHGIVLVDSGLGTADVAHPTARLGVGVHPLRPALLASETALAQLEALGYRADDVSDVVATHLDYDHIGGASDFAAATVHATSVELAAAIRRRSPRERARYRADHLDALPPVENYGQPTTSVLGLASHQLDDAGHLHLIPMPGHTRGHAAVAVRDPDRGWLIHAGDAAMHRGAILSGTNSTPWPLQVAERALAMQASQLATNHRILNDLHNSGYRVFCSHDRQQYRALRDERGTSADIPQ